MATNTHVDVLVVGGGPAGTSAALTLLRYSPLQVMVVEGSTYSKMRVGETVAPSIHSLLEYLGARDSFLADNHLQSYATSAAWGSQNITCRDFLFTGRGEGWHLDRKRFDRMLAEQVCDSGGLMCANTRVTQIQSMPASGWRAELVQHTGMTSVVEARFVIDASGQTASFARRFGATWQIVDHLVGVIGYYQLAEQTSQPHITLVESDADGWWYSAPLPNKQMVVAFMSDADQVHSLQTRSPSAWLTMLQKTIHTRERLQGSSLCSPPIVCSARSHLLYPSAGSGWIAAGDAAATFDPLSSMGIGHALTSGMHAARVAYDWLTSDGSLMKQYIENMVRNFDQYLALRYYYYTLEQRWATRPFWARRHHLAQVSLVKDARHDTANS